MERLYIDWDKDKFMTKKIFPRIKTDKKIEALLEDDLSDYLHPGNFQPVTLKVICDQTFFALDEKKYQEFIDILDAPPKADEELRKFLAAKSPWD
jgi:Protein of unknown function (DUF1778)